MPRRLNPKAKEVARRILRMGPGSIFGWVEKHTVKGRGPYYVYRYYDSRMRPRAVYLGKGELAREAYIHSKRAHERMRRLAKRIFFKTLRRTHSIEKAIEAVHEFHEERRRKAMRILGLAPGRKARKARRG